MRRIREISPHRADSSRFSQRRWAEWNGQFRDDVRQFWRGDAGMAGRLASRICGSADLYHDVGKGPECSINFITCHDGFTLNDLVSYARVILATPGRLSSGPRG